jgi:hypothetical protein
MKLPSDTPPYFKTSSNSPGKEYVQMWFKLPSKINRRTTTFTIFKGRVITKTQENLKINVYLNKQKRRVYYSDSLMKPKGRTISMKMPQKSMLTDNWNAFTISGTKIRETPVKKPKFSRPNSPTNSMGLKNTYPGTISPNIES